MPLRERLRDVMRARGVWSTEPLREPLEETDEASSSTDCQHGRYVRDACDPLDCWLLVLGLRRDTARLKSLCHICDLHLSSPSR